VDAYATNILLQKISQISGVGLVASPESKEGPSAFQGDPQGLAAARTEALGFTTLKMAVVDSGSPEYLR